MQPDPHEPLRRDIRRLGDILGGVLREQEGQDLFDAVERVRQLSKRARDGEKESLGELQRLLFAMPSAQAWRLARAFSSFLHLANVAEQYHRVRRRRHYQRNPQHAPQPGSIQESFARMRAQGVTPNALYEAVCGMQVELVLTAHPTEIARVTVLHKFRRIGELLEEQDRGDLTPLEWDGLSEALRREITALWHTDEVRSRKPSPQEEALGGLLVFEQTLWKVVPRFLRELDGALRHHTGQGLPLDCAPIRFCSWMGGDRDGNPTVTAEVTREICLQSRLMALTLYEGEINALADELSLSHCSPALRERVGETREPYRKLLLDVRSRLAETRRWLQALLKHESHPSDRTLRNAADLIEPLHLCYQALNDTGAGIVADGRLLDLLRRAVCFGLTLVRLDVRQEAARHRQALDEITRHLGIGAYAEMSEGDKQAFLIRELQGRRPLIPRDFAGSPEAREVLATFAMLAETHPESLGAYVISMAQTPSDVLAVLLLQREHSVQPALRVVPLFETMAALGGAGAILQALLSIPWYRDQLDGRQEVMIGYSDSAKESGRLAAAWAIYQAQEDVVATCARFAIEPVLFHGRGGSVSRGGGPTHLAIRSQPPGAVNGRLRITVQGEMVQAEFGTLGIAVRNLELYLSATLEASLLKPAPPEPKWRAQMERLAGASMNAYQAQIGTQPFVDYFRAVTPERELSSLNVGSRPAKRSADGGLESLRAIPWVFAWTQVRLILPTWLGVGEALQEALSGSQGEELQHMYRHWQFFQSTLDVIEMVLAKADPEIFALYNEVLVPQGLQPLGKALLARFQRTVGGMLTVAGHRELLEGNPVLKRSIQVRNPYVDPINLLQIELLRRLREGDDAAFTRTALLATMNGVAAGMRNTG
ncbi:MAG: phosphoenolpyruvate carboxylase [Candidatus Lambdaproteobacteria bacterium]|nr:phosphoenolpyruvate carboxylase [Candidatus Lambdaproteobacteria bacterium]